MSRLDREDQVIFLCEIPAATGFREIPIEIKSRLMDGKFHVIGKITKYVEVEKTLSLGQHTFPKKLAAFPQKNAWYSWLSV